jgi:anti-sigma28 factor (negative regulator of flagellin synthesis)
MNELKLNTKIDPRKSINESNNKGNSKPMAGSKFSSQKVDKVTLSEPSKSKASGSKNKPSNSEIRHELVNKFRKVLQNDSYEVKANEIAEKIVQKIRENKNHLVL